MRGAENYSEWLNYARQLDTIRGLSGWRLQVDDHSKKFFDNDALAEAIFHMKHAQAKGNPLELCRLLQIYLHKNFGGKDHAALYSDYLTGTKAIIEEFNHTISECLQCLRNNVEENRYNPVALASLHAMLKDLKHSIGNTALSLSGGGELRWTHVGVVEALVEVDLLPKVISGASGGALVAGYLGTQGLARLKDGAVDMTVIQPPLEPYAGRITSMLKTGRFVDSDKLVDLLKPVYGGDITFLEAYRETGITLNISVCAQVEHDYLRVLNHITAPEVLVWSAVMVSVAFPLLIRGQVSKTLYCKDAQGNIKVFELGKPNLWFDGSFANDVGPKSIPHVLNVSQIVVSQVNYPFLVYGLIRRVSKALPRAKFLKKLLKSELGFRWAQVSILNNYFMG